MKIVDVKGKKRKQLMPCIHDNKSEAKWQHISSQDWLYKRDVPRNNNLYKEVMQYCMSSSKNAHLGHATDKIYVSPFPQSAVNFIFPKNPEFGRLCYVVVAIMEKK